MAIAMEANPDKRILDLEERSRFVEELALNLTRDKLDEAIGVLRAGIELVKDLEDVLIAKENYIVKAVAEKDFFTLTELEEIELAKRKLQNLKTEIGDYKGNLRLLEEKIVALIPKPKTKFKLRTDNYLLEIENGIITKIETI